MLGEVLPTPYRKNIFCYEALTKKVSDRTDTLVLPRKRKGRVDLVLGLLGRRFFRKWDVGVGTGSSWLWIGQVSGICECGNKPPGFIKRGEFLD
jgi:hypothetical protein